MDNMAKRRRPAKPAPDPRETFKQAFRFFIAILGLHQYRRSNPQYELAIDLPMLVLTAFMCELGFKAQIGAEGGQIDGQSHDLMSLFGKLKPATQSAIEAKWNKVMAEREADTQEMETRLGVTVPRDLREALEASKNSFVQLRYIHETGTGDSFIGNLPLAIGEVLVELHPDWATL